MKPGNDSPYETIRLQIQARTAWITLCRPQLMNCVSPQMVEEIGQALDALQAQPEVLALVFTGEGRAFCAGADLAAVRRLSGGDEAEAALATGRFLRAAGELLTRIEQWPRPVLAAVNGLALAGGLELVLVCDLVIAADDARFGDAHARHGLIPGWGASARLPRKVGPNRAKQLMFTADRLEARILAEWGLVNEVVPAAQLLDATRAWCDRLTDKSPLSLSRMKQLVHDAMEQPLDVALRNERTMVQAHLASEDRKEGLAAFAEKRSPQFRGR